MLEMYIATMKILLSLLCLRIIQCSLISRSIVKGCDLSDTSEPTRGDGQICRKKFVVSMTLRSDQEETEALYANINTAYDEGNQTTGTLKKPYRIEIAKSEVLANYRVYYRGSVNALPTEHVILNSNKFCVDGFFTQSSTCGTYFDSNGRPVWDSQGFCCYCERQEPYTIQRSYNASCGSLIQKPHVYIDGSKKKFRSSAHCMNFSKLWYDVYEIESPNLHYNITVSLKGLQVARVDQKNKKAHYNWTALSNFTLTPANPAGRSANGKVVAEIQGDLLGGRGLMDLTTKRLLIPSLRAWHEDYIPEEYRNGPRDWLLVDEHLVDLDGRECNKIGLSFSAFRLQPGKCFQAIGSCFTNQPSHLWRADNLRREYGIKGFYMMHNYGKIHPSTHINNSSFIMRLIFKNFHNTFITFRIDAGDLAFIVNIGKGRIVRAESRGFNKSTATSGEVLVVIENQGEITQQFNVVLQKCFGRDNLPSSKATVFPGQTATLVFPLLAQNKKKITVHCEVQLFDQQFTLLGTARLTFHAEAPCFCFGICDCTCDEITGKVTEKECPTPPPIYVDTASLATRILLYVLDFLGLHTIVAFFAATLICCGLIRLMFGGVIVCRKTKAQQYYDEQREKGALPKGPALVKCSGECRGAKAAKARVKRRAERMRRMGKDPHYLDDWANTSFVCNCNDELTDIRCVGIIKALCFFYYLLILPFILLGKKIWWCIFKDTVDKKKKAETAVIKSAKRKGAKELEKLGVVSIRADLQDYVKENKELEKRKEEIRKIEERKQKKREMKKEKDNLTLSGTQNTPAQHRTKDSEKTDHLLGDSLSKDESTQEISANNRHSSVAPSKQNSQKANKVMKPSSDQSNQKQRKITEEPGHILGDSLSEDEDAAMGTSPKRPSPSIQKSHKKKKVLGKTNNGTSTLSTNNGTSTLSTKQSTAGSSTATLPSKQKSPKKRKDVMKASESLAKKKAGDTTKQKASASSPKPHSSTAAEVPLKSPKKKQTNNNDREIGGTSSPTAKFLSPNTKKVQGEKHEGEKRLSDDSFFQDEEALDVAKSSQSFTEDSIETSKTTELKEPNESSTPCKNPSPVDVSSTASPFTDDSIEGPKTKDVNQKGSIDKNESSTADEKSSPGTGAAHTEKIIKDSKETI